MRGLLVVRPISVCRVMQSKMEIYQAKATQCELRAREMPPALRRMFLTLAAHWRKLASDAGEAADRRRKQEAADRRNKRKSSVDTRQPPRLKIRHRLFACR
jgi:hypothetical protein